MYKNNHFISTFEKYETIEISSYNCLAYLVLLLGNRYNNYRFSNSFVSNIKGGLVPLFL